MGIVWCTVVKRFVDMLLLGVCKQKFADYADKEVSITV